jgi:hypothetical protein
LVVKVSCKKLKATDSLLYTQAELWLKKELKAGEVLKVDTGCIRFYKRWITISSSSAESKLYFGGEGLFYATPRGPGTVYIQSLPLAALPIESASAPRAGGDSRGEGSILAV